MYIFAAGALFTINFDFWLMYAFSEKIENYLHGFFRRVKYTCEIGYSVSPSGWGQFTLTEPICTASSCINRSLSIIDDHIYIKANISICRQDLFSFRLDVSA